MANLESTELARLRDCLNACAAPLLIAGVDDKTAPEQNFHGVLGLIDWRVHGLVSQLLTNGLNDFNLVPNSGKLGKASLLLIKKNSSSATSGLAKTLGKLGFGEVCVAETTFSDLELQGIQATLRKAQVSWNRLESLA